MIKREDQIVNICVRGVIIEDGELIVTEFKDKSWAFFVGGRVDFGESLMTALHREMKEEIDTAVSVEKLLYFHQNIFTNSQGTEHHEYGYYFLVHPEKTICPNGESIPNPDSERLIIRRYPIDSALMNNIWPPFLRDYLPKDYADDFQATPHFLYSDGVYGKVEVADELAQAFGLSG